MDEITTTTKIRLQIMDKREPKLAGWLADQKVVVIVFFLFVLFVTF
jgi:hypothetical protein